MVGQNLGAKRPDRSERSAYAAASMALAAAAVTATVFFLFPTPFIEVFNKNAIVVGAGAWFLRATALGMIAASIAIVLGRALNGAGDTRSPLVITLIALWGFQIPAAIYLSGIEETWGYAVPFRSLASAIATHNETGVWYAMVAASVLQALITALWFGTGRWKHKRV